MTSQVTINTRYTLNNGTKIPAAGFGLYLTGKDVAKNITYEALKAGYRHIDSAAFYRNEKEGAEGIKEFLDKNPKVQREDVYFTTKVWDSDHGYEKTKAAIKTSLLKVEPSIGYIDLFLVHSPMSNREGRLGTWKALQEAVKTGKVKSIGVSNYGIRHLEELLNWDGLTIKPVVDQLELHPWLPRNDIHDFCKKHDIYLEAYTPLTRGKKLNDPELVALSKKYNYTPAQILLKWSYAQGFIVLAKTVHVERIKENLSVFDDVELNDDIVKTLYKPNSYETLTWDPTVYTK